MESAKGLGHLQYHFLTMPPIRKANKALLKQRCSFMLEQSFSVTLNFPESVWDEDTTEGQGTTRNILDQSDAVVLRPLLYGKLVSEKKNDGAICSNNFVCTGDQCPFDNSWGSLVSIWVDYFYEVGSIFQPLSSVDEDKDFIGYTTTAPPFNNTDIYIGESNKFQTAWKKWILATETDPAKTKNFVIDLTHPGGGGKRQLLSLIDRDKNTMVIEGYERYLRIGVAGWKDLLGTFKISCVKAAAPSIQHADYKPVNRDTVMFYC